MQLFENDDSKSCVFKCPHVAFFLSFVFKKSLIFIQYMCGREAAKREKKSFAFLNKKRILVRVDWQNRFINGNHWMGALGF